MKNVLLDKLINQVINDNQSCVFTMDLTIGSTQNLAYSFQPIFVDSLNINKKFGSNICDDIQVSFKISYRDYAIMYSQMINLTCILAFKYKDHTGREIDKTPIVKNYRVIMVDPVDITKRIPDALLRNTLDTSVTLRLIEPAVYNSRLIKINTIFSNTDVSNAIKHLSVLYGIDTISMVTSDNDFVYEHIVIPPNMSFDNFGHYIQHNYGVYMQGMSYYVDNNILYMYQPFDTNPSTSNILTVYQADIGAYAGSASYCSVSGSVVSVVTNQVGNVFDLSPVGNENEGTNKIFLKSTATLENNLIKDNNGTLRFNDSDVLKVSVNSPNTFSKDGNNTTFHTDPSDNPYEISSTMSSYQNTMIDFIWNRSLPFSMVPGMKVIYYSDENGLTAKRVGIVDSIDTKFINTDRTKTTNYVGISQVTVRLSPKSNQDPAKSDPSSTASIMTTVKDLFNF